MTLIYKVLFPSLSTLETPPTRETLSLPECLRVRSQRPQARKSVAACTLRAPGHV